MKRLSHYLFIRHRHNWILLSRFAVVGGSGVVVNLVVFALLGNVDGRPHHVFVDLPGTDFNIRGYHVYSTIAFLVANLSNFQLNRAWTFRSIGKAPWLAEFVPFFAVGALGQAFGLLILTALLHHGSPVELPKGDLLDGSTGLRERENWAQVMTIAVITPVSFVGNKMWTFRAVRSSSLGGSEDDDGSADGRDA